MNRNWMRGMVAVAVVLLAVPCFAQTTTTGRIDGVVVDDSGAALPGVTVTVNSPALQGERLQVTGADGKFRFLSLPPGDYDLKASLEGFSPLEQSGIDVQLSKSRSLQLTMSTAFGEEVTVSGAAPIIDTTSTTSGANFGEELFQELPVGRTFTGIAFAAPGVVSGGLGNNPSIGGASAAENRYVVDGLDTTDPAFGTFGTQVPFEFVKEVEIKTGGYEAEYGGALGGIVNVVTKSGGNELQGDIFGYFTDDSLQSETPPTTAFGTDKGFTEYDFGAAIGGKIIQDKLWYFVAANPSHEEETYTTRGELREETEETDRVYFAGKLTWQVNPSNQLVFSLFGDPNEVDNNDDPERLRSPGDQRRVRCQQLRRHLQRHAVLEPVPRAVGRPLRRGRDLDLPIRDVARYEQRSFGSNPGTAFLSTQPCGPINPGVVAVQQPVQLHR